MNTIQELTDQLYNEGVQRGKEEAGKIISEAETRKQDIISEAEKQAADILADARKQASELEKNTRSELRLFAAQALEALKSEVVNLLNGQVVETTVKAATADKAFMQQMLLAFVQQWGAQGDLVIETADAAALTDFFKAKAAEMLKQGLEIRQVNGIATDFVLSAKDGSYKIQLGEQEFVEYFKEFLRPKLVEMLF